MPRSVFSGALPPKKKFELQEIAVELGLNDGGTKDELVTRLKKHLDLNQDLLEDNPSFSGLYTRRKKSVQPHIAPSSRLVPTETTAMKTTSSKSPFGRRVTALDPVRESTPVTDLRDVSMYLKHPLSPTNSTPNQSPRPIDVTTPSSLPPLPPSPVGSSAEQAPNMLAVNVAIPQIPRHDIILRSREHLSDVRTFLSNSRNIWSLTAVLEIFLVVCKIVPWTTVQLPLLPNGSLSSVPYPQWTFFQTPSFWLVILHWSIPTLIIPAIVGHVVSFTPTTQSTLPGTPPMTPFDPLTASIIRLAAQVGYPYPHLEQGWPDPGLDVLGFRWRVLISAVGLAFSFAEAIAGAPQAFASTLRREQGSERALVDNDTSSVVHKSLTDPHGTAEESDS